jgi:hypothetical protein
MQSPGPASGDDAPRCLRHSNGGLSLTLRKGASLVAASALGRRRLLAPGVPRHGRGADASASIPKFELSAREREEILSEYLVYCETVRRVSRCPIVGRDPADQPFLDLAHSARVGVLVTGDKDLLVLADRTRFTIETPAAYRQRFPELIE